MNNIQHQVIIFLFLAILILGPTSFLIKPTLAQLRPLQQQQQQQQQRLPPATEEDEDVPSLTDVFKQIQKNQNHAPPSGQPGQMVSKAPASTAQPSRLGQGIINVSPPAAFISNPQSTQPIPDSEARRIVGGCSIVPVIPEWVSVDLLDRPVVAEGVITSSPTTVNHHEWPFSHQSHDNNFHVYLDSKYTGLASVTLPKDEATGQRIMEMEWEIGTANTGITDRFPKQFWPWEGDRVWMMGRWVWDCGHQPYKTEIHPPFATAFTRSEPYIFPGDNKPSSAVKSYIYIHGQGGYYNIPVG
ncbi:MAG TPA: hypothetical protein VJ729_12725, partial [Nitrososphaeraceae archaeon]|nr:hypothetical protein [Nitrososphaeraceae archaeon]